MGDREDRATSKRSGKRLGDPEVPDIEEPTDTKYLELRRLECLRAELRLSTNPKIQTIADAFRINIERVLDFGKLPGDLFNRGMEYHEVLEGLNSRTTQRDWKSTDEVKRQASFEETIFDHITEHTKFYSTPRSDQTFRPPPEVGVLVNFQHVGEMKALMSSMVVAVWTAFEVMAQDLWEIAVNEKPGPLLKAHSKLDKFGRTLLTIKLELKEFDRLAHNLSGKIGTILKDEYVFIRYDAISDAYKAARGRAMLALDTNQSRGIFNLAKIRNAIVHASGTADEEFMRDMVSIPSPMPQFTHLTEGKPIPIDGLIVATVLEQAIRKCIEFLSEVDLWVSNE